jgi:hypothetical protein
MFVCCEYCVLSGRGLCDELITRPEESHQLWRVVVCDQETSKTRRLKPATGLWKIKTQWAVTPGKQTNKQTLCIYCVRLLQNCIKDYFAGGISCDATLFFSWSYKFKYINIRS